MMKHVLLRKIFSASAAALATLVALTPLHANPPSASLTRIGVVGGEPELGGCAYTHSGCDQHGNVYQPGGIGPDGKPVYFDYDLSMPSGITVSANGGLYRVDSTRERIFSISTLSAASG